MVEINYLHSSPFSLITHASASVQVCFDRELALPRTADDCYHPAFAGGKQGSFYTPKEAFRHMQSSVAVAGRALIMLLCVVGIPIIALSDVSWSEMLKKLQNFRCPAFLEHVLASTSKTAPASLKEAPPFTPLDTKNVPLDTKNTPPGTPNPLGQIPTTTSALPLQSSIIPVSFQSPIESSPALSVDVGGQKVTNLADLGANPLNAIQERLRCLGTTYYLLESWGNQQQMYRFFCKTAIGGSADYTRCFEATHTDPLQAMLQVLRQVEAQKAEGGGRRAE
jgi:hypothetical protein